MKLFAIWAIIFFAALLHASPLEEDQVLADIEEKDVDLEDKKEDAAEEETKDEDKDEETKDEDKSLPPSRQNGCNGVAGPPCCPNLAQGEMEGGREEALAGVAFVDCPAACKKKGAHGVTTDNNAQSCYCEFGGQTWNRADAHYKTCVIKKCQYQNEYNKCDKYTCTGSRNRVRWMKKKCAKKCLCDQPASACQNQSNKCDRYTCTGSRNRVKWMKKMCAKKCVCGQAILKRGPAPTCTCNDQTRKRYGRCRGRKQSGKFVCYVNVDEYGRSGCSDQMKSRNGKWYYSYNACEGQGQGK